MREMARTPLFSLGQVVATPGAVAAIEKAGAGPQDFLSRHVHGDWGELSKHDRDENHSGFEHGFRLLSTCRTDAGEVVWVVTEADRSVTIVLLPNEY
jgi:hypothetical protein